MPQKRGPEGTSLDLDALFRAQKHKKGKAGKEEQEAKTAPEQDPARQVAARAAVVELLAKSLHHESVEDVDADRVPEGLAEAIECELHDQHSTNDKAYKAAVRNLVANLKRNAALARRVCAGEVSAAQLVRMSPAEMATEAQQQELAQTHDKLLRAATLADAEQPLSDHTCPECKSHACSAVESMAVVAGKSDTWGAKQHEGKGRVVKCLTCGHRWEASDM